MKANPYKRLFSGLTDAEISKRVVKIDLGRISPKRRAQLNAYLEARASRRRHTLH